MENDFRNEIGKKQFLESLKIMVNTDIPVIEKYKQFAIYHNLINHLAKLKTTFKKDWIEINHLADRIIWEKENGK